MTEHFDVVVAGGGTAGVSAAVASARTGARTLLAERNHCLGGAATMRNVLTWCGLYTLGPERRQVVGGIAEEVLLAQDRLGGLGPVSAFRGVFRPFDPETLKVVLDDLAEEAGVDVRFGVNLVGASRRGTRLQDVTLAHSGGTTCITAAAFVDATGDGDLAARSGAATRYGNPDGVNLGTMGCRFGGIPADVTVTVEDLTAAIDQAGFPPGAISKDRCVIVRLPRSHDMALYLASEDYDPRDPASLSQAERSARRQVWQYLRAIRAIPGCQEAYLVNTGPEIGTREARHLECHQQMRWEDIVARRRYPDVIALGAWGAEWHDRATSKSAFDYPPDKAAYEIPLGCLHSRDTPNLFCAGRLADGDRKAGAAIRVMGTAMATGQAAGTAAALVAGRRFSAFEVQSSLRTAGALLDAGELA